MDRDPPRAMPLTDEERAAIYALERKGWRVFPAERVRVYAALGDVPYRTLLKGEPKRVADIEQRTIESTWHHVGHGIGRAGGMVVSREDADNRTLRTSCMVILPNDFDFEREAWGIK